MSFEPLISVITVSYNHAEYLQKNIDSVLEQNYANFEHIVIDGGSTDETVEILKKYPHLNWISEADRGQSHALNKGFKKAQGEIIAWLNSDDYYPPGVFKKVASYLKQLPIVMGACEVRYPDRVEIVPNIERNWFDLLKYWVYDSSLSQPAIFFRRSILEEVKLPNGDYIDEQLNYCMDLDLWLRIARFYNFNTRIEDVLAVFPKYEESKTGGAWEPVYREIDRVFRRYENIALRSERYFSFLLPVQRCEEGLVDSLKSIATQNLMDSEILLIDYAEDSEHSKGLKELVTKFEEPLKLFGLRLLKADKQQYFSAVSKGLEHAHGRLVAVVPPGTEFESEFCLNAVNLFQHSSLALALLYNHDGALKQSLNSNHQGQEIFSPLSVLKADYLPPCFVARNIALQELKLLNLTEHDLLAMPAMLLAISYKAWQVTTTHNLNIKLQAGYKRPEAKVFKTFRSYINAMLISRLDSRSNGDSFATVRASHGFGLNFPKELLDLAQELLSRAPENWWNIIGAKDEATLIDTTERFPEFSPAWQKLVEHYLAQNEAERARVAEQGFMEALRSEERFIALSSF